MRIPSEDLQKRIEHGRPVIYVRTQFPKRMKKGTIILSDFGPASYDIIRELHYFTKYVCYSTFIYYMWNFIL